MEFWQWALTAIIAAFAAGVSTLGVFLVVMQRDRSLIQFIGQGKQEALDAVNSGKVEALAAIELAKEDLRAFAQAGHAELHARINRVHENFVRRDDFQAHERRVEKSLDGFAADMRRVEEKLDVRHAELKQILQSAVGLGRAFAVPTDKL